MEKIGIVFPAIMMVGLGIVIGMYISSQIKCHIGRRINNKELIKNLEDEQKKRKD
jgi:type III secretory pathway component EscR